MFYVAVIFFHNSGVLKLSPIVLCCLLLFYFKSATICELLFVFRAYTEYM